MGLAAPKVPEGVSNQCPLCRKSIDGQPATPSGDLACPHCGGALWFVRTGAGLRYHDAKVAAPVRDCILDAVSRKFELARDALTGVETFADLGADSLDVAELIMELEEDFNVTIADEEVNHLATLGDLIDYVLQLKKDRE